MQLRQNLGSDKRINDRRLQNCRTPLPPLHKLSKVVFGELLNVLYCLRAYVDVFKNTTPWWYERVIIRVGPHHKFHPSLFILCAILPFSEDDLTKEKVSWPPPPRAWRSAMRSCVASVGVKKWGIVANALARASEGGAMTYRHILAYACCRSRYGSKQGSK